MPSHLPSQNSRDPYVHAYGVPDYQSDYDSSRVPYDKRTTTPWKFSPTRPAWPCSFEGLHTPFFHYGRYIPASRRELKHFMKSRGRKLPNNVDFHFGSGLPPFPWAPVGDDADSFDDTSCESSSSEDDNPHRSAYARSLYEKRKQRKIDKRSANGCRITEFKFPGLHFIYAGKIPWPSHLWLWALVLVFAFSIAYAGDIPRDLSAIPRSLPSPDWSFLGPYLAAKMDALPELGDVPFFGPTKPMETTESRDTTLFHEHPFQLEDPVQDLQLFIEDQLSYGQDFQELAYEGRKLISVLRELHWGPEILGAKGVLQLMGDVQAHPKSGVPHQLRSGYNIEKLYSRLETGSQNIQPPASLDGDIQDELSKSLGRNSPPSSVGDLTRSQIIPQLQSLSSTSTWKSMFAYEQIIIRGALKAVTGSFARNILAITNEAEGKFMKLNDLQQLLNEIAHPRGWVPTGNDFKQLSNATYLHGHFQFVKDDAEFLGRLPGFNNQIERYASFAAAVEKTKADTLKLVEKGYQIIIRLKKAKRKFPGKNMLPQNETGSKIDKDFYTTFLNANDEVLASLSNNTRDQRYLIGGWDGWEVVNKAGKAATLFSGAWNLRHEPLETIGMQTFTCYGTLAAAFKPALELVDAPWKLENKFRVMKKLRKLVEKANRKHALNWLYARDEDRAKEVEGAKYFLRTVPKKVSALATRLVKSQAKIESLFTQLQKSHENDYQRFQQGSKKKWGKPKPMYLNDTAISNIIRDLYVAQLNEGMEGVKELLEDIDGGLRYLRLLKVEVSFVLARQSQHTALDILADKYYVRYKLDSLYREADHTIPSPDDVAAYLAYLIELEDILGTLQPILSLAGVQMGLPLDYLKGARLVTNENFMQQHQVFRKWYTAGMMWLGELEKDLKAAQKRGLRG